MTFVNKLRVTEEGKSVCIPCSGYTADESMHHAASSAGQTVLSEEWNGC